MKQYKSLTFIQHRIKDVHKQATQQKEIQNIQTKLINDRKLLKTTKTTFNIIVRYLNWFLNK